MEGSFSWKNGDTIFFHHPHLPLHAWLLWPDRWSKSSCPPSSSPLPFIFRKIFPFSSSRWQTRYNNQSDLKSVFHYFLKIISIYWMPLLYLFGIYSNAFHLLVQLLSLASMEWIWRGDAEMSDGQRRRGLTLNMQMKSTKKTTTSISTHRRVLYTLSIGWGGVLAVIAPFPAGQG